MGHIGWCQTFKFRKIPQTNRFGIMLLHISKKTAHPFHTFTNGAAMVFAEKRMRQLFKKHAKDRNGPLYTVQFKIRCFPEIIPGDATQMLTKLCQSLRFILKPIRKVVNRKTGITEIGTVISAKMSGNLKNIATMMEKKNVFFIPMVQDDPVSKPFSLVADFSLLEEGLSAALRGENLRPVFLEKK